MLDPRISKEVYCRSRFSRSRRYLNSLPARNACLPPRSLTFLPPRNSHFDQFEFFAGAATVDFTASSPPPPSPFAGHFSALSFADYLSLSLSRLTVSVSLILYPSRPPSLSLARVHTYAYIKAHPSHVFLPSVPVTHSRLGAELP